MKFAIFSALLVFCCNCFAIPKGSDSIAHICEKVSSLDFPLTDRPNSEEEDQLKGCQSMVFYYGIGVATDYEKARKCAFLEMALNDHSVFAGSSILMMIYANGQGVHRNLDLSTQLACKLDSAPMETAQRVSRLQDLKKQSVSTYQFDICDDITSGFMQGNCAQRDAQITEARLEQEISSLTSKWPKNHQNQFKYLREAATNFFETRIENEVDLSGTARAALQSEEQENLETDFTTALEDFEKGKLPSFTSVDYKNINSELNEIYSSIVQSKDEDLLLGTVTIEKIKQTQKAWLRYCNAWLRFAAVHYPSVSIESWKTWLDKNRIEQLRNFYS